MLETLTRCWAGGWGGLSSAVGGACIQSWSTRVAAGPSWSGGYRPAGHWAGTGVAGRGKVTSPMYCVAGPAGCSPEGPEGPEGSPLTTVLDRPGPGCYLRPSAWWGRQGAGNRGTVAGIGTPRCIRVAYDSRGGRRTMPAVSGVV